MKRTNKLLSLGLAILLGAAPLATLQWPSFATERAIPDRVLFSSSFEADEAAPQESKSDNGYYQNVEAYKIATDLGGEFTYLVSSDSIDGSPDDISGEGKAKVCGVIVRVIPTARYRQLIPLCFTVWSSVSCESFPSSSI